MYDYTEHGRKLEEAGEYMFTMLEYWKYDALKDVHGLDFSDYDIFDIQVREIRSLGNGCLFSCSVNVHFRGTINNNDTLSIQVSGCNIQETLNNTLKIASKIKGVE